MALQSGNIIPLNSGSHSSGLLPELCSRLNQLTSEHIYPETPSLIPYLLNQINEHLETAESNQEIICLTDCQNALRKQAKEIEDNLRTQWVKTDINTSGSIANENAPLVLLDNDDLDHKLIWVSASEHMATDENAQRLFRIKQRFNQAFPHFDDLIPATPDKLCSGFSESLSLIRPDFEIEQKLLQWFSCHIQSAADTLWIEVDKLLDEMGLPDIEDQRRHSNKMKQSVPSISRSGVVLDEEPVSQTEVVHVPDSATSSSQPLMELSERTDSQLMDSLAEKLVLRVEDMLVKDNIIPEAKLACIRSSQLASVLNDLQSEINSQHLSIINLTESITKALEHHDGSQKLSRRHEDLINLVGLLFEYILDDHQLPEDIRKEIALLQIPILKLAICEQDFLGNREHPARILLNEMTSASMGYNSDLFFSEPLLPLIEKTVRTIISESQNDLSVFERSLETFQRELHLIRLSEEPDVEVISEEKPERLPEPDQVLSEWVTEAESTGEPLVESGTYFEINIPIEDQSEFEEKIILESTKEDACPDIELGSEEESHDKNTETIESEQSTESDASVDDVFIQAASIRTGQWVDVLGEGQLHRMRCKLSTINTKDNRYLFVNGSGMRVAEYTSEQLQKEIDQGNIVIQEYHQIFDRALHAVIEKFKKK